jgi:GDSL-like Lipase/Acylhydrolase family
VVNRLPFTHVKQVRAGRNPLIPGTGSPAALHHGPGTAGWQEWVGYAWRCGATINDAAGSQMSVLRPGPALVTLTVGGNDAGFANVLQDCIFANCVTKDSHEGTVINGLLGPLYNAYLRIKAAAPELKIIVLTYPQIVTAKVSPCAGISGITKQEVTWIRARTAQMDAVIKKAAAAAGVQVLDEQNAFRGHEICRGTPSCCFSPRLILVSAKTFPQDRAFTAAITSALPALLDRPSQIHPGQVLFLSAVRLVRMDSG